MAELPKYPQIEPSGPPAVIQLRSPVTFKNLSVKSPNFLLPEAPNPPPIVTLDEDSDAPAAKRPRVAAAKVPVDDVITAPSSKAGVLKKKKKAAPKRRKTGSDKK